MQAVDGRSQRSVSLRPGVYAEGMVMTGWHDKMKDNFSEPEGYIDLPLTHKVIAWLTVILCYGALIMFIWLGLFGLKWLMWG